MKLATAKRRISRGHVLHFALTDGGAAWWFECPYAIVPAEVAQRLVASRYVADAGDCLFPDQSSGQTFKRAARPDRPTKNRSNSFERA